MPQRHGCHQGMGAYQSPSLAVPHFQPDPAGLGALAARSEAGGAVGSARAGPIRRCRRPATPGGRAQNHAISRAIGMRRGGRASRFVFSGPKAKADGLPGPEKGIAKAYTYFQRRGPAECSCLTRSCSDIQAILAATDRLDGAQAHGAEAITRYRGSRGRKAPRQLAATRSTTSRAAKHVTNSNAALGAVVAFATGKATRPAQSRSAATKL